MLRRSLSPSLALAGLVALSSYYGLRVYSSATLPSGPTITSSDHVPDSFAHSFAVSVVNPHRHVTINDTRSIVVSVLSELSQEQILAKFVSGFFGGFVFAPERTALRLFRQQIVNFKGKQSLQVLARRNTDNTIELENTPPSTHIWAATDLNRKHLPPLHSILFGAFRIVDIQLSSAPDQSTASLQQDSYVDIAFGADNGFIAGVHRFSVSEIEGSASVGGKRLVSITYDHTSCNPKDHKPLGPDVLQTLHLWYAMLLFREGVVNVLKAE